MAILIDNRQQRLPIDEPTLRKKSQAILDALACPEGELSVMLVDDTAMTDLNRRYLNRQGPTNVIAFPMREGEFADVSPDLLGDVVISMDTCRREGEQAGLTTDQRFYQLLVHGILHLFGYDHVDDDTAARAMTIKSNELLALINEPPV